MKNMWMLLAVATFCVLALTAIGVGAQSISPTSPTYSWSGELVSFDPGTRMVTVKTRVFGEPAKRELPTYKAGDRIVLTWSGYDTYADGILRTARFDAAGKWNDPFTFPVEFVAYDGSEHTVPYATFRFQVPSASVESVKLLKPGEWITTTSRHRAATESEAIMAVNSYVITSSPKTSTN
jgi:hypothetical protein